VNFADAALCVGGAALGSHGVGQGFGVEARRTPWDVAVVHLVGHAVITEGAQEIASDALGQVAAVDEVFAAQAQEVAAVGAFGCGGQAEEEVGFEVVDEASVGGGGGVVKFVDHDVIEVLSGELLVVFGFAQGLHRGEEDVGIIAFLLPRVKSEACVGPDAAIGAHGLAQDLFSMGHEEDAVEGGEPGLAQPGGQDHQARFVAPFAGLVEGSERFLLDGVRAGDLFGGFDVGRGAEQGLSRRLAPLSVVGQGGVVERDGVGVVEEGFEGLAHLLQLRARAGCDAVVPLHPGADGRAAEVGAAHVGGGAFV